MQSSAIGSSPGARHVSTSSDAVTSSARAGQGAWPTATAQPPTAAALAAIFGVSVEHLNGFATQGGRLSLWWSSTGGAGASASVASLGLPTSNNGAPDFSEIVANGGTVTGALPPAGYTSGTYVVNGTTTTVYAAQVDRGDGSAPVFVKGADIRSDSGSKQEERAATLQAVVQYLQQLPNNLQQARLQCYGGLQKLPTASLSVNLKT